MLTTAMMRIQSSTDLYKINAFECPAYDCQATPQATGFHAKLSCPHDYSLPANGDFNTPGNCGYFTPELRSTYKKNCTARPQWCDMGKYNWTKIEENRPIRNQRVAARGWRFFRFFLNRTRTLR
eukprot:TRINITY_DN7859_c0_g1_i1.p1 TRINITY_DN7859_c0_g1~~TRINITY_DN7859_c0_g1_i1.p1  ORF type:complete len:124 (+),score=6.35 TRINITY_DN7859_c0_g1_i1:84-455(+)